MYTDLIKIEHPPKASYGDTVEIQVYAKNQHSEAIYLRVRTFVNGVIPVPTGYCVAQPGVTYIFTGYFTMPNEDAEIKAESGYWAESGWHYDDYQTRTVCLETVTLRHLITNRDPVIGGYVTITPLRDSGPSIYDAYYPDGTTVTVTAHPFPYYVFKSWSGALPDTTNPTTSFDMDYNRTITAHFEPEELVPTFSNFGLATFNKI